LLYPVQYGSPALHSDTLEDSEHGESDVIEAGDARVWTLPAFQAYRGVRIAHVGPGWVLNIAVRVAWAWQLAFFYNYTCNDRRNETLRRQNYAFGDIATPKVATRVFPNVQ